MSLISCQKESLDNGYRYFIEWDSWKTGLHSNIVYGNENAVPRQVVIEKGDINEYRLLIDSKVIDSFTTQYPNHVKNGQTPFYIKNFYRVD